MSVQVETLEKLERRITLTLPTDTIKSEVESRLKRLARTVKADGFRPGKVPMSVVAQRYGYSVHYEVMNDKVGEQFNAAVNEAKLRVAGAPRITEKDGAPEGQVAFDATFEVYPEVKIGDLTQAEIERVSTEVSEAAIDRTVEILRKQRRTFGLRGKDEGAVEGDRVLVRRGRVRVAVNREHRHATRADVASRGEAARQVVGGQVFMGPRDREQTKNHERRRPSDTAGMPDHRRILPDIRAVLAPCSYRVLRMTATTRRTSSSLTSKPSQLRSTASSKMRMENGSLSSPLATPAFSRACRR